MYSDDSLVCICSSVTVCNVKELKASYPLLPNKTIKSMLSVGKRCGACNYKECPTIDVNFETLVKEYE